MKLKLYLALILLAFACKKADVKHMFVSSESVNLRFNESISWNLNNGERTVLVNQENYILYIMADSHVGGTKNLNTFLQLAKDSTANAVVMLGDLTTGWKADYTTFENTLNTYNDLNIFTTVGNHDLYFDGWPEFLTRFGASCYTFTIKTPKEKDLYICLDSGSGTFGKEQLDWLKSLLKNKRENYRNCIVLTHLNFFRFRKTASTNPLVKEVHTMIELFTKYNVNMVITGHDHKNNEDFFGKTIYLNVEALSDDQKDSGYLILNHNGNQLSYTFKKI